MLTKIKQSLLEGLCDKTIHHIDCDSCEEFALVHFTDGTMWLVQAIPWNCGGAKLNLKFSWSHHIER